MNVSINGHEMSITPGIQEYVEKRVGRLERYLPTLDEARVDLREQQSSNAGETYVTQITLYDKHGTILRAEEHTGEVHNGIDLAVDKLHRQIKRFKGKRRDRSQRAPSHEQIYDSLETDDTEDEEEEKEVVRVKRFAMVPMNEAEAIEQMELLGHNFFIFYNADEGDINVLYRRRDGNYGLIIPQLI